MHKEYEIFLLFEVLYAFIVLVVILSIARNSKMIWNSNSILSEIVNFVFVLKWNINVK